MKQNQEVIEIKINVATQDIKNIMSDSGLKPSKRNLAIFMEKYLPSLVETLKSDAFDHISYDATGYLEDLIRGN